MKIIIEPDRSITEPHTTKECIFIHKDYMHKYRIK